MEWEGCEQVSRMTMARSSRSADGELTSIAWLAMLEHDLLPEFSNAVDKELKAMTAPAREQSAAIRDLRDRPWASVDNDDSRDLDQLTGAEPLAGAATRILLSIADVDAMVKRGSAVDAHARTNTTSVYTAAGVFPMLPEKLSTDLTSLGQGEERLATVIEMTVDGAGVVTQSDIYRAMVLNRAKLAYNSVAAWLDGEAQPPERVTAVAGLDAQLRLQDRVAQSLKKVRHARGALDLETLEVRPVFDNGDLTDMVPDEKNRARELIED